MQWLFNPLKGLRQNAHLPLLCLFLWCICAPREFSIFSVSFEFFPWCLSQIPNPTSPKRDVCYSICVVGSNPKKLIWAHAGKTQWADVPDKSKFLRNQMCCQCTYYTRDETRRVELYIVNKTNTLFSVSLDRDDGLLPSSSPSLPTCQFFRGLLPKSAGVVVNGHQGLRILNNSYHKIFYVMKYGAQCSSGL